MFCCACCLPRRGAPPPSLGGSAGNNGAAAASEAASKTRWNAEQSSVIETAQCDRREVHPPPLHTAKPADRTHPGVPLSRGDSRSSATSSVRHRRRRRRCRRGVAATRPAACCSRHTLRTRWSEIGHLEASMKVHDTTEKAFNLETLHSALSRSLNATCNI